MLQNFELPTNAKQRIILYPKSHLYSEADKAIVYELIDVHGNVIIREEFDKICDLKHVNRCLRQAKAPGTETIPLRMVWYETSPKG